VKEGKEGKEGIKLYAYFAKSAARLTANKPEFRI
jgi:hypothetical protein